MMVKVEDVQNFAKEQMEVAAASARDFQSGSQAIAAAFGDYAKKSFEDGSAFVEKLSSVKSVDKAIELQTEFTRSAYESFVAEAQKIGGLYADLAKLAYKPYQDIVSKMPFAPAA